VCRRLLTPAVFAAPCLPTCRVFFSIARRSSCIGVEIFSSRPLVPSVACFRSWLSLCRPQLRRRGVSPLLLRRGRWVTPPPRTNGSCSFVVMWSIVIPLLPIAFPPVFFPSTPHLFLFFCVRFFLWEGAFILRFFTPALRGSVLLSFKA